MYIDTRITIFKIFKLSNFKILNPLNPFKNKKRIYPVYFREPFVKKYSLKVVYNEFLLLTKYYKKFKYEFKGGTISYDFKVKKVKESKYTKILYLDLLINIEKALFTKEEYKDLRKGFVNIGWLNIADFEFTVDIM